MSRFSQKELEKLERLLERTEKLRYYGALPNLWMIPQSDNSFIVDAYTYSDRVCGDLADIMRPIYFIDYNGDKINFETHIKPLLIQSEKVTSHQIEKLSFEIKDWLSSVHIKDVLHSNIKSIRPDSEITASIRVNGDEVASSKLNLSSLKSDSKYANLYFNSVRWHANTPQWDKLSPFEKELAKRQMFSFLASGHGITLGLRSLVLLALGRKENPTEKLSYNGNESDPISALKAGTHFSYTVPIPMKIFKINQWVTPLPVVNSSKSKHIMLLTDLELNGVVYENLIVTVNAGYVRRRKGGELWMSPKKGHLITLFDPKTLKDGRFLDISALF